jgi:hypothetical protein
MGRGLYPYVVELGLLSKLPKPATPSFASLLRRLKKRLSDILLILVERNVRTAVKRDLPLVVFGC